MMTEKQMVDGWFKRYLRSKETVEITELIKRMEAGKFTNPERQKEIIINYIANCENIMKISFEIFVRSSLNAKVQKSLNLAYEAYIAGNE